jgi:DNA-binding winged helix-turn-helix (wHTH) protein
VRIQPQPLRVLELLVERPGEILSREELRNRIWGEATFVEFDQGLSYCIRQIRSTLGEAATQPSYIETLPKQGYRFIASVTVAQDVKLELEWMRDAAAEPSESGTTARASWRAALPWALLGATALAFMVFAWMHRTGTNRLVPADPVRLQIPLPARPPLRLAGLLALSPNGQELAFVATSADGIPRIWLRALNALEIRPLPGTESVGTLLFWSPDSRFLAFDSGGELRKINVSGGPAEAVCVLNRAGVGGSWNKDGAIIFGQFGGAIMRVSAEGGVPAVIGEDRVFPPKAGATSGRQRVEGSFEDLLERAGIQGFRFHDLRHTFASWFMMNGGDLYELAKILGHSNIKMTERYAKLARQHLARTGSTAREIWKLMECDTRGKANIG